jgi:HEAT repeat protein
MQATTSKTLRARPTVEERRTAIKALDVGHRTQLLRSIGSYLKDPSARVRETALEVARDEVLSELDDQIIGLISNENSFVRQRAIECFGSFHAEEAIKVPWLHPFLQHPEVLTKIETLETLDQIGDKSALPAMIECLRDDDYLVRAYAAISIAQLGGKRFRKQIETAAKAEEAEKAKPWFARALFLLGDQKQFQKLLEFLSSTTPTPRCTSANALADLPLSPAQQRTALAAVANAATTSSQDLTSPPWRQLANSFLKAFRLSQIKPGAPSSRSLRAPGTHPSRNPRTPAAAQAIPSCVASSKYR